MRLLLILLVITSISGCSLFTKEVIRNVPVHTKVQCPYLSKLNSLDMLDVTFVKGVDEEGNYIIGLSGKDYSKGSINNARMLEHIKNQKEYITYYKNCIETHNKKAP